MHFPAAGDFDPLPAAVRAVGAADGFLQLLESLPIDQASEGLEFLSGEEFAAIALNRRSGLAGLVGGQVESAFSSSHQRKALAEALAEKRTLGNSVDGGVVVPFYKR